MSALSFPEFAGPVQKISVPLPGSLISSCRFHEHLSIRLLPWQAAADRSIQTPASIPSLNNATARGCGRTVGQTSASDWRFTPFEVGMQRICHV